MGSFVLITMKPQFILGGITQAVEIYFIIGLENEAKKYASLLGYNYQSSMWYENTYQVFNKNYKKHKINKEDGTILNKFKSLFE